MRQTMVMRFMAGLWAWDTCICPTQLAMRSHGLAEGLEANARNAMPQMGQKLSSRPETPLPFYPCQRTLSDRPGWSASCHERTLAPWLSSDRKSYGNLGEYN